MLGFRSGKLMGVVAVEIGPTLRGPVGIGLNPVTGVLVVPFADEAAAAPTFDQPFVRGFSIETGDCGAGTASRRWGGNSRWGGSSRRAEEEDDDGSCWAESCSSRPRGALLTNACLPQPGLPLRRDTSIGAGGCA